MGTLATGIRRIGTILLDDRPLKQEAEDTQINLALRSAFIKEDIKWLGFRQTAIDVECDERYEGKSSYSMKKRINMAVDLLTSQSDKIIRLFVTFGFIMSIISFLTIIGLVIYKFVADVSIGWTSIIATIILVGGLIIMVIGIVGIYVGNIFMQTKDRPLYIIRQILNDDRDET